MLKHIPSGIFSNLTQSELTVLRYIDSHQPEIIKMSIQQLAAENYTSTATVLRLCKKLRLDGYAELKYLIKNTLKTKEQDREQHSASGSAVLQNQLQVIKNTGRMMDMPAVDIICDWLMSGKRVHLYAGGLSAPVLEYMQRFLLSAGRPCLFYSTAPLGYRAADKMTEHDLLIIASASGSTPSVIRIAQIAKNSGAAIAAVTNLDSNPLARLADLHFFTFIANRDYFGTDIKARAPLFYVISTILECYLFRMQQARRITLDERSNPSDE